MALAVLAESLTLIQIKPRRVLSGRRLFVSEVKLVARNAARRSGATSRGTECEGGNSLCHKWAERQLRAEGRANLRQRNIGHRMMNDPCVGIEISASERQQYCDLVRLLTAQPGPAVRPIGAHSDVAAHAPGSTV